MNQFICTKCNKEGIESNTQPRVCKDCILEDVMSNWTQEGTLDEQEQESRVTGEYR